MLATEAPTIALPTVNYGPDRAYAGYVSWDGTGYSWECWYERADYMGVLRTHLCGGSEGSYGSEDRATAALVEHVDEVHES